MGEGGGGGCLYVIGMHRSGTSAVTGLLIELGLEGPSTEDVPRVTGWNARSNFESARLIHFNDQLLADHGGSWGAPRPLEPGWETDAAVADRAARAARVLGNVFPGAPFVWKDPRNCLLLPFWRTVIPAPTAAVFVYRSPLEVAGSMAARDGFTTTHGLALWERYVRAAAANLRGLPTLVVGFSRVLEDTRAWCGELTQFLDATGFGVDPSVEDRALRALDGQLRHVRHLDLPDSGIYETQRQVLGAIAGQDGAHDAWIPPDLGDEPEWVEDVLPLRRQYLDERHRHEWSASPFARVRRRIRRTT